MAQQSAIETLIELAEKEADDAAKALGKAISAHEDTVNKLNLLLQYRSDYEARLQNVAASGLTISQFSNFNAFIAKLDEAVNGQQIVVRDAERKVELAKSNWQAIEKRRLSYQTLKNRADTVQQQKEAKRDQKQTDDFASRSYLNKLRNG
jgi:flagellar FliJ protein